MALELLAPAKLNLVFEVLGRRPDGYHEVATVMHTLDLADSVRLEEAPSIELSLAGDQLLGVPLEGPRNLAFRAARALAEESGRGDLGVTITIEKRVPAGLGLGGGSSDAAAVLRGLDRLWRLGLPPERLSLVASRVGSDVAFFLAGGSALATGRGEVVEALPDPEPLEFTLFLSDLEIEAKTLRMYAALSPADYSDGRRARVLAESLRRSLPVADEDLFNAFDRHIGEVAPPMARAMAVCREAGLAVFAAGSGPGFYCKAPLAQISRLLLHELQQEWGVRAIACRSLPREAALSLREV